MYVSHFADLRRVSQQLSADNQAAIDWADDTEFRLSVPHRELKEALGIAAAAQRQYAIESQVVPRQSREI